MFASEGWEELHLAPEGRKNGSYRHVPDNPVMIEPPANDVLTMRRYAAAVHDDLSRTTEDRTPRTDDIGQIEQLLLRHGTPTFGVQSKNDAAERVAAQCLGVSPSVCAIFSPRDLRKELVWHSAALASPLKSTNLMRQVMLS